MHECVTMALCQSVPSNAFKYHFTRMVLLSSLPTQVLLRKKRLLPFLYLFCFLVFGRKEALKGLKRAEANLEISRQYGMCNDISAQCFKG